MKKLLLIVFSIFISSTTLIAQEVEQEKERQKGHYNISKFQQLNQELPTPNKQHTASGAPGYEYTQQQVDYEMDITLDDANHKIYGDEKITYHNNSKDALDYLWVQLDQNMRAPDSKSPDVRGGGPRAMYTASQFTKSFMGKPFEGGFNIEHISDANGLPISYMINRTMMRVDLPKPLPSGESFVFNIKWWYNVNNYTEDRGRSGWEFLANGNTAYAIAQFFPRLCVYNNVEGWQNLQFWGTGEFTLEFGNYAVNITTPADFVLNGTGVIQNPKEVLTKDQYKRYQEAQTTYDNPMYIVTPEDVEKAANGSTKKTKTWKL